MSVTHAPQCFMLASFINTRKCYLRNYSVYHQIGVIVTNAEHGLKIGSDRKPIWSRSSDRRPDRNIRSRSGWLWSGPVRWSGHVQQRIKSVVRKNEPDRGPKMRKRVDRRPDRNMYGPVRSVRSGLQSIMRSLNDDYQTKHIKIYLFYTNITHNIPHKHIQKNECKPFDSLRYQTTSKNPSPRVMVEEV